jgi:O-acetyl-ADP-ribose deacetylase
VVRTGDITAVMVDAVVNGSNTRLKLGSGVSGALRRACGPGLQAELDRFGGVSEDGMVATGAHRMGSVGVILHVPTASGHPQVIRRAVDNVLRYCAQNHLSSVALPALGAGVGGLKVEVLAELCAAALRENPAPKEPCTVHFVLWDTATFAGFEAVFGRLLERAPR